MNEWMNEWCIYIALYCVLLYTQSALQSYRGSLLTGKTTRLSSACLFYLFLNLKSACKHLQVDVTGCCRKDFSLLKSSRPCGADLEVSKRYKHVILAEWNTARHIFDLMRVISRTCRLGQMAPDLPLLGPSKKSICYYGIYIPVSHEILVWRGCAVPLGHMESIWSSRVDGAGQARGKQASKLGTCQCLSYPFTMNYRTEDIHSSQSPDPSSCWKIQKMFIKGRYFTHSSPKNKNLVIFTHLHVVPNLCHFRGEITVCTLLKIRCQTIFGSPKNLSVNSA